MKRLLLRAKKDPLTVVSPEETHAANVIGNNSGNLLFSHAAYRMLSRSDTEITANEFRADPAEADLINERYDAFVVPLANAFRRSFAPHLRRLTTLIERLRIPVVVLGVGAQGSLGYDGARMAPIEPDVQRFVRAVLERSPTIGVRGEFTLEYLNRLGFSEVEVIGCPSMFLHGNELPVTKRNDTLTEDARLAITISPYVKRMTGIVDRHHRRYPNLTYIAQDIATLGLLLWGEVAHESTDGDGMPVTVHHPLYQEDKIRLFVDPAPWLSYLGEMDFSFGTRIHGSIAALMAGIPCHVLAHDSRTLELARYFDIPHTKLTTKTADLDAAELYAAFDVARLQAGHSKRFTTILDFLHKHGLSHAFDADGDGGKAFDARVAETRYPGAVRALLPTAGDRVIDRVHWLRSRDESLSKRVADLEKTVQSLRAAALNDARTPVTPRRNRLRRVVRRLRG